MEKILLCGNLFLHQLRSFFLKNDFLQPCKMIVVAECNGKYNDLIEHDSVVTFPENSKFCKGIDHDRNKNPDEHQFQFLLFRQYGFYGKKHLKKHNGKPNKSKIHENLHKSIVRHFSRIRMGALEKLFVIDPHKAKA